MRAAMRAAGLVLCAGTLAGCAIGNSYCLGDQPYSHAPSVAALQPVEGLKVPQSGSTLKIPPAPANPVPFGQEVTDAKGKKVIECLDHPPPLPPQPDEAKPEDKAKTS